MNASVKIYAPLGRMLGILFLGFLLFGCGGQKQTPPVPVGQMEEYRDPGYGFHISYPQGWLSSAEVGHAQFFSQPDVEKKFLDPTGAYPNGVMIEVSVAKTQTAAQDRKQRIDEMVKNNFVMGKEEGINVAGMQAYRNPYSANWGSGTKETGEHIYLQTDTLLYDIRMAGFGDLYDAYRDVFTASLNSFQLPKPAVKGRDETLPSDEFTSGENNYFRYQYPGNFNVSRPAKGSYEFVEVLQGANRSTSVRFDVFDAKNLTLEKVFDQNKGKYRATSTGKATVSGEPAMWRQSSATKDVDRRFYFMVYKGKVLRITVDWVKAQRDDYLAAYEQVLSSIKFK
ncbi:hypothetical protein EHM92_04670 [bacterium]|nr:MAG: hypothetical protein EHM92_04670 [bacterium]